MQHYSRSQEVMLMAQFLTIVTSVFVLGFLTGYGVRAMVSRHHHKLHDRIHRGF
jgi:hypothetical protein